MVQSLQKEIEKENRTTENENRRPEVRIEERKKKRRHLENCGR
jgi:hypothetical protein